MFEACHSRDVDGSYQHKDSKASHETQTLKSPYLFPGSTQSPVASLDCNPWSPSLKPPPEATPSQNTALQFGCLWVKGTHQPVAFLAWRLISQGFGLLVSDHVLPLRGPNGQEGETFPSNLPGRKPPVPLPSLLLKKGDRQKCPSPSRQKHIALPRWKWTLRLA